MKPKWDEIERKISVMVEAERADYNRAVRRYAACVRLQAAMTAAGVEEVPDSLWARVWAGELVPFEEMVRELRQNNGRR